MDKLINEIAEAYAQATVCADGFSPDTVQELRDEAAFKASSVIQYILQNYNIRPKFSPANKSTFIKTVGDFRRITESLDDDYEIEMRIRRKLKEEELKYLLYPYPYETEYTTLEFDDVGVADKVLCLGVERKD